MNHVAKLVSWWFVDRVMNFLLDADAAAGTNLSTARAIDIYLKKLDSSSSNDPKETMSSLCADAGGGGTREGLGNEMHELRRTCPIDTFLATTCSHHGFNLMMVSPC